ncbi:MAG: glycosyl transferase family protein, partial [Paracoccaceae bacterium]|nr:glycosyl transferase family protein [Paracoccaceae bacterium]
PKVDIDWSTYAGKRIQLPWFVLSVMALVNAGYTVTMHGTEGHTPGRVYTREIMELLGLPIAKSLQQAADQVHSGGFTYIPLEVLSPRLRELIDLRPIFGLRSPVHTFSRMLNPFSAETMMQGIFHRGFMDIHAGAAQTLGQERMSVFRGEGGEIERRPNKPTPVWMTHGQNEPIIETWPQQLENGHQPQDEEMDTSRLADLWAGKLDDGYALASVIGTIAVTLRTMGKADSIETAETLAKQVWDSRDKSFLPRR